MVRYVYDMALVFPSPHTTKNRLISKWFQSSTNLTWCQTNSGSRGKFYSQVRQGALEQWNEAWQ